MDLKGKIAIVAGGAGGIGQATALRLASEGCYVAVADINPNAIQTISEKIRNSGYESTAVILDVTNSASVEECVKLTANKFGSIHILVNTMASPIFGSFLELDYKSWERVLQVKYLGSVRTMREVLPYMIRQKFGRIVNISGSAGKEPSPLHLAGGSVNAAINQLTKGLAREMGKYNIRINVVSPAPTATERAMQLLKAEATEKKADLQALLEENLKDAPLGRMANPEEIAEVIAFLVSERSSYVTGAYIAVDGGRTRSI